MKTCLSNEFHGNIFQRIALKSCPTVHLGGGPMIFSESYLAIYLRGLSKRILSEIGIMFSGTKTLLF